MPRLAVADSSGIHPDASAACTWLTFDSLPPIRPPYLRHLPTHPHTPGAADPPYATHIATRINHMALLHTAAIVFSLSIPTTSLDDLRAEAVRSPSHPLTMTSWTSLLGPLSYAALALPAPHAPMRAETLGIRFFLVYIQVYLRSHRSYRRHADPGFWGTLVYSFHLLRDAQQTRTHGGYSSVGRASDCGSEGRAFEPR